MPEPLLYDLIDPRDPQAVEREVIDLTRSYDPAFEADRLRALYRDIVLLFHGLFPGYRASDAWYHDLEHTNTVFLCVAAMLHGAHQDDVRLGSRARLLALACALFHDVGLIRRLEESEGNGARYTVGHEQRSIEFTREYFARHGYDEDDALDAQHIILCTALSEHIDAIPFRSEEIRTAGRIVASADVVAQMADRAYLEKLLLLFREFREAQIPGYGSELELLEKTPDFYQAVVRRRLDQELGHADAFLDSHARVRWGVQEDPYHRSIERNLAYLHSILTRDKGHYREHLRRGGVIDRLDRPGAKPE